MTPAEIVLVIGLIQQAVTAGEQMYEAAQLKALADLEVKLQAQLTQTGQDRVAAEAEMESRDKALEGALAAADQASQR